MAEPISSMSGDAIWPLTFWSERWSRGAERYLNDASARKLIEFFEAKGVRKLKEEDRREQWYEDWLGYQAKHRLYASLLSPKCYSALGNQFDLLRLTRFYELLGYVSPSHGYSMQVTFLGLFSILMGSNESLKREAVASLEDGGLFALGVSEKSHGSDLLGNEFTLREIGDGRLLANGAKYYIGNANCASIISILARREGQRPNARERRAPFALFALRPGQSTAMCDVRKIHTLGVRAAYVGEFEVHDHELPESDVIAEGRAAWDAVIGTVTLGKFFLGFGSIGICERALEETIAHLSGRILYGEPVIAMPHIRAIVAQAYARLTAMKLYAYRALDYVHAADPEDRRYVLYCAVQKAKASTEGVKVVASLSECIGAKGFEADTYFEMALRDVQLIPGLEGSTHINLGLAAQFLPRYFGAPDPGLAVPKSLLSNDAPAGENPFLMRARAGSVNTIRFPPHGKAYEPFMSIANVQLFAQQAESFRDFLKFGQPEPDAADNSPLTLAMGQILATIAYAQLVAENSAILGIPGPMVSAMFHVLVSELNAAALSLASLSGSQLEGEDLLRRLVRVPRTTASEWAFVSGRATETIRQSADT